MSTEPAVFGPQSFRDLVRLLEQHPEWRADLRRLVLSDELLELPSLVQKLVDAQSRTENRLDALIKAQGRTEERLNELTEAQRLMAERLDALAEAQHRTEERLAELAEAQRHMAERLDALAEAQRKTEGVLQALISRVDGIEQVLKALVGRVDRVETRLGAVLGESLELRYRNHSGSYFGPILRRARPLSQDALDDLLDGGIGSGVLTDDDAEDIRRADLVLRGRAPGSDGERYLVIEVSSVVDQHDVERARRRAAALGKLAAAGAVVAGEEVTPDAERDAVQGGVWQVFDGRVVPPDGTGPDAP